MKRICGDCGNEIQGDYHISIDQERFICADCHEIDMMMYHDGIYGRWTADGRCISLS